jgi:hypothetical protein
MLIAHEDKKAIIFLSFEEKKGFIFNPLMKGSRKCWLKIG